MTDTLEQVRMVNAGNDFVFLNSKSVFIEYIDIIRAPYFFMLYGLSKSDQTNPMSVLDLSPILGKSDTEISEFYYTRRNQNPLYDLAKDGADYAKLDDLLDISIESDPEILRYSPELNCVNAISSLLRNDDILVKKIYVYYPYPNAVVESDVMDTIFHFTKNVEFVSGPLEDVLKSVPDDSTYIFSDISKIDTLARVGKLNLASVVLPFEYGYNYEDPTDVTGNLVINLDAYMKENLFKIDFFLASIDTSSLESTEKQ